MYIVKKTGYIISNYFSSHILRKAARVTYESRLWKIWRAIITPGTCYYCASMNGRILAVDDPRIAEIPVHPNCKCHVEAMTAIAVGTATKAGSEGVDLYVAIHGRLPDSYLTQDRLPVAIGRVWYEADFDYVRGYRNGCRLLYSNDGLIFVTYDHYLTFYEIGLEAIR